MEVEVEVESSVGDLLKMRKLKNTDGTNFHNDQCNLPRTAQISNYHNHVKHKMGWVWFK